MDRMVGVEVSVGVGVGVGMVVNVKVEVKVNAAGVEERTGRAVEGAETDSIVGERELAEGAGVMVSKGGVRTVTELLGELDRDGTSSVRGESEGMTGEVDTVRVGVGDSPLLGDDLLGENGLVGEREGDSREGEGVGDGEGDPLLLLGEMEKGDGVRDGEPGSVTVRRGVFAVEEVHKVIVVVEMMVGELGACTDNEGITGESEVRRRELGDKDAAKVYFRLSGFTPVGEEEADVVDGEVARDVGEKS